MWEAGMGITTDLIIMIAVAVGPIGSRPSE